MVTEYTSKDEAIKEIKDHVCFPCPFKAYSCTPEKCGTNAAMKAISEIPAADVRPVVRGEWERPKGSTPRSWIFVCSKCGDRAYFPVPKYFPKGCGYSFCPNCGADMGEAKDG